MKRIILSIDGGGARGIIPALVINEIYTLLGQKLCDELKPFHSYIDCFIGTSVGALISALLSAPSPERPGSTIMTPEMIPLFMRNSMGHVFPRKDFERRRRAGDADESGYDDSHADASFAKAFGELVVGDALANLVFTTYDPVKREPVLVSNIAQYDAATRQMKMRDAIRATTAAPTFHGPASITPYDDMAHEVLLDGAVYMNDPSFLALMFSTILGFDLNDTLILSLGTGQGSRPYDLDDMRSWTAADWSKPQRGFPLFSMLTSGQAAANPIILDKFLNRPGEPARYIKIDGPLQDCSDDLDDASPENIARLEDFAGSLIRKHRSDIEYAVQIMQEKNNS